LIPKWLVKASAMALASTLVTTGWPLPGSVASAMPVTLVSQQSLNGSGMIASSLDLTSSAPVSVIVQLAQYPAAVAAGGGSSIAPSIEQDQARFVESAAQQGITLQVGRAFQTVFNGLEVTLPANQIPQLAQLTGVKSVYPNRMFHASSQSIAPGTKINEAPYLPTGIQEAWNLGYSGRGVKIGLVDTGIDYQHPDLRDAYKGGYNVISHSNDPYEDIPQGSSSGTSHGTAVASIIAGRGTNAGSPIAQKGLAHEADLYVYKVLGYNPVTNKASGSSAQVMEGLEKAVEDGMDIISMALSSADEQDPNAPEVIAVNNAVLAGKVVVTAATNTKSTGSTYSITSPAQSPLAISTGAVDSSYTYTISATSSLTADPFDLQLMGKTIGYNDLDTVFGSDPLDGVYVGLGLEANYEGMDVSGRIVLVSRGMNSNAEKSAIAKKHGAKAIIIFNGDSRDNYVNLDFSITNRDGYINSPIGDHADYIPTFDMKGMQGRALAKAVLNNPSDPLQFALSIQRLNPDTGRMTIPSFSGRGPVMDSTMSIKPDFLAPGVSVVAAQASFSGDYSKAYMQMSGSSPATGFVVGAAALLKQRHPEWTPYEIRAALANTASPVTAPNAGSMYDVYSQGAGLINVKRALATPAVLQTVETISIMDKDLQTRQVVNYNDTLGFGVVTPGGQDIVKQLRLVNSSDQSVQYRASIQWHFGASASGISATLEGLDNQGGLQGGARGIAPLQMRLSVPSSVSFGNYEGEIVLESDNVPTLRLPFAVEAGTQLPSSGTGFQELQLSAPYATKNSPIQASIRLNASDMKAILIEAYGMDDVFVGTLGTYEVKDSSGSVLTIPTGRVQLPPMDGTYTDNQGNLQKLENGIYKLVIYGSKNELTNPVASYVYKSTFGSKIMPIADAAKSFISASKATVTADGTDTSSISVMLKDDEGKAVAGKKVLLTAQGGQSSISPPSVISDTYGKAEFTVTNTKAEIVTYSAKVSTDQVTLDEKETITFTAGAPDQAHSFVTASSLNVSAEFGGETNISVSLADKFNNPVAGKAVNLQTNLGSSTITPNPAVSTADGKASFKISDDRMETVTYSVYVPDYGFTLAQTAQISFVFGTPPTLLPQAAAGIHYDEAPVSVTALVYGRENAISSIRWVQGVQNAGYFHTPGNGTAVVNGAFMAPANDIYTVYVRDTAGNENVGTVLVNSIRPRSHDSRMSLLSITGAYGAVTVTPDFDPLHLEYTAKVNSGVSSVTVTPTAAEEHATMKVNGVPVASGNSQSIALMAGKENKITIEVVAHDLTTTRSYSLVIFRASPDPEPVVVPIVPPVDKSKMDKSISVVVNGKAQEQIAEVTSALKDGKTEVTVSLPAEKLITQLAQANNGSSIVIPVDTAAEKVSAKITGDAVKRMEQQQMTLEVQTGLGSYKLPAADVGIDRLSSQFNGRPGLSDITMQVEIRKSSEESAKTVKQADSTLTLVGSPIEYTVTAAYNGQSVEVHSFDRFVERSIALPTGVTGSQVTTAVVVNSDQTIRPVPTYMMVRNGVTYAVINSMTNSTYALIYRSHSFADVTGHWSEATVSSLASRLILHGAEPQRFAPDASVTRAEFAAMLVRGMGLPEQTAGTSYLDVTADEWFHGAVEQARQRGLVEGYEDGRFYPNRTITREEAFVMIARAMKLADIETGMSVELASSAGINAFEDRSKLAEWAAESADSSVKAGIVTGAGGRLNPKQLITRAETATLIERVLKAAKLIP
jgi:subtilisin family serine protease